MELFKMKYLIIGAGLSGGIIARELADRGNQVTIWERRAQISGNMFDYIDKYGILVQQYGPHTFHTKQKYLYDYMCKYEDWKPYELTCGAVIQNKFTPTPFNFKTIDQFYPAEEADDLKKRLLAYFQNRQTVTVVEVLNADNEKIRAYGEFLFQNDYSLYTAKQWGISPAEVDPSILKRVPLRLSYEEGYFDDDYQVMPKHSYYTFFKNLLKHKNIQVKCGIEALDYLQIDLKDHSVLIDDKKTDTKVIYTGALDELFQFKYGKLPYRSLRFEWKHENKNEIQPYPVTAYPSADYTRITEYNKLPVQTGKGTTYAIEYSLQYEPDKKQEPYYPVLTRESQERAAQYKRDADSIENFYYCGRLADFKYYNMDQALERALQIVKTLL